MLQRSVLQDFSDPEYSSHEILSYDRTFADAGADEVSVTTRIVLRVGADVRPALSACTIYDGSMDHLKHFEAQVLQAEAVGRLSAEMTLSGAVSCLTNAIVNAGIRSLPPARAFREGDLLEVLTIHRRSLGGLGVVFSIDEPGHNAAHVSCTFAIPKNCTLQYQVVHDSISPEIVDSQLIRRYIFRWRNTVLPRFTHTFSPRNNAPAILAVMPTTGITTWESFGTWYLSLIAENVTITDSLRLLAQHVVAGHTDQKPGWMRYSGIASNCCGMNRYILNAGSLFQILHRSPCNENTGIVRTTQASCIRSRGRRAWKRVLPCAIGDVDTGSIPRYPFPNLIT